jgi:hypothetical protein
MLSILYGSGLRVSEVTRLKVADIDSARNVLWVRFGKGRKDRKTGRRCCRRSYGNCCAVIGEADDLRNGFSPARVEANPALPVEINRV